MTKRLPIESYSDCFHLFDLALERGGIRIPFPTAKAAIHMRHRLYRARRRYFDQTSNPQYNDLFLQIVYDTGEVQGPGNLLFPLAPCAITVQLHSKRELPQVTDLDGNPINQASTPAEAAQDDLMAAALSFKSRIVE